MTYMVFIPTLGREFTLTPCDCDRPEPVRRYGFSEYGEDDYQSHYRHTPCCECGVLLPTCDREAEKAGAVRVWWVDDIIETRIDGRYEDWIQAVRCEACENG